VDSLHEIAVNASALKVFEVWTTKAGLEQWWTADVTVPKNEAEPYVFGFDKGSVKFYFQIVEQLPGVSVRWTAVDGPNMPAEWVDTQIDVRLSIAPEARTRMQFAHRNWRTTEGFYCVCNTSWGELMYRLRDVCEGRSRGPLFT
jgi:uncharacterized protein YndB with AHSA1/START domain